MTRYVIVDFMHLVYKTVNLPSLKCVPKGSITKEEVNTTIPTHVIKNIYRYSNKGMFPTAVCLEGGCPTRKNYFQSLTAPADKNGKVTEIKYKDRGYINSIMGAGIDLTVDLLHKSGVSCYRANGYEADDFIYTLVLTLKERGITDPIDIITNDRDILPLVDEQVSVYIKNPREFYEEDRGAPRRAGYFQVTPRSWDTYVFYASEYEGYTLPYNSVLLYKMLHGDKSDNIPSFVKGYGKKKLTQVVDTMKAANVPFESVFRYGLSKKEDYPNFLGLFFKPEEVEGMMKVFKGIDLMRVETNGGVINTPTVPQYGQLQRQLDPYYIDLSRA